MKKKKFMLLIVLLLTGIVASAQVSNCYNVGSITATGVNSGGIAGLISSSDFVDISSALYLNTLTVDNTYGTALSEVDLKNSVNTLNGTQAENPWIADISSSLNNGYPVLSWQDKVGTNISLINSSNINIIFSTSTNTIRIENIEKAKLSIFNTSGILCRISWIDKDNPTLSINELSNGVYIVNIQSENSTFSKKIIKN